MGQKQRPPSQRSFTVRPRDRLIHIATLTNTARPSLHPVCYPPRPTLSLSFSSPFPSRSCYLVLPPSQHRSRFRPIKTLYDHVVQRSVRRFFLFFGFFSSGSLRVLLVLFLLLPLSVVSSTCISFSFAQSHCSFLFSLSLSVPLHLYSPSLLVTLPLGWEMLAYITRRTYFGTFRAWAVESWGSQLQ